MTPTWRRICLAGVIGALTLVVMSSSPRVPHMSLELVDGRMLDGVAVRREGQIFILTMDSGAELAFPVELVRTVHVTGDRAPQTLAGPTIVPPRTEDQLAVLGEPAEFQKNLIDPRWTPSSDWNMDPHTQNNFNPSTWSQSPIDPSWQPRSDWGPDTDVLKDSRSRWRPSIIDSTWAPTDGFAD